MLRVKTADYRPRHLPDVLGLKGFFAEYDFGMQYLKPRRLVMRSAAYELRPNLEWKAGSGKLYFTFNSAGQTYSSGRLIYDGEKY